MRFFTIEWWQGGLPDAESDAAVQRYAEHLGSIRHLLPPGVDRLDREVRLHDSRLRSLDLDVVTATATATLDLVGGGRVRLRYTGLRLFSSSADPQKGLGGPHGYGDWGYDEFDVLPNGDVEHRILFSSGIELTLVFADLVAEPV